MQKKSLDVEITNLSEYIHQAALDPHLNLDRLNQICDASNFFGFKGFCTNLIRLPSARKRLSANNKTKLIAAIGLSLIHI